LNRAAASRTQAQAAESEANFPDDWKAAEAKYTQAQGAPTEELQDKTAAAALFNQAADAYDGVAKKSAAKVAKDKDDNTKALNAAIARLEKSRKDATTAKADVNFPAEWKAAETKRL